MKYVLASSSPRRRELIKNLGLPFEICPSDAEETLKEGLGFGETVMRLSRLKAKDVYEKYYKEENSVFILGADTIVVLDNNILGKPKDKEDAFRMLRSLRGRSHTVYTGMCLIIKKGEKEDKVKSVSLFDKTQVYMANITDKEIISYIESGEPMDKAGSYGIQKRGSLFIERIEGNYNTVVGLNTSRLYRAMKENGLL